MRRIIFAIIYVLSFAILPILVLSPAVNLTPSIPLRLVLFCLLAVIGAALFRQAWPHNGWVPALLITSLGYGFAHRLAGFIPDVSSYPLSLGWSEASRYYYASLWLSKQVYGMSVPPSVLHPTRYLLQAIPFLIPGASLWFNRFWQVLLWVVTAGLTSFLLVWRLGLASRRKPLAITLSLFFWGFLFLFLGPVYYHLLVMVIIILWGFDRNRFWRNLVLVLLASLWAGISRVNWLPVPGLLAAALYLLEVPKSVKPVIRYLAPPAAWVLAGTAIGYASQQAYQLLSGNPIAWFGSSFTSDLLWYRLFPNPTYPLGILLSVVLVSLPVLCLMVLRLVNHWKEYHLIRILGLVAILGVLFVGGVLVSVKIGGGSNLHNLDAYLTLLLVIGSYIYFDHFEPDQPGPVLENAEAHKTAPSSQVARIFEAIFLVGALVIPLYFILSVGGPLPWRDFAAAQAAVETIKSASQQAADSGGEVLFITQRHLLTFDAIQNVPLVSNYELVFLMEMAMANNRAYLDEFDADVSSQRYAMIVSDPLTTNLQGPHHSFGEENDAWVKNVSEPVLCYYEPAITLDSVGVVLYTPRQTPCK